MIGTNLRSTRQLWRLCDSSLQPLFINDGEFGYMFAIAIKITKSVKEETLLIFNKCRCNCSTSSTMFKLEEVKPYSNEILEIGLKYVFTIMKDQCDGIDKYGVFKEIVLLPKDFLKSYEAFLKSNSKMISSLDKKYGVNFRDINFYRIFSYSDGSKNFFSWAANIIFGCGVGINCVKNIFQWNELYGQLVKNLSKGTITAYTNRESIEHLIDELTLLRKNKRIIDAINSFNTSQKKLLKAAELTPIDKETLSKFSKLTEAKKLNFIKKVSTINDFNELMRQMRHVCSVHFSWNKESLNDFLENVENINYKKIFENDTIVLVEALDYNTIKQLAKTTNWCISKNKTYWNNYVENDGNETKQYVVFDFSKKEDENLSIIGFTTKYNKGITFAHDFVNNNLMNNNNDAANAKMLNSYISNFLRRNSIFSILEHDGIDINKIVNFYTPNFKWDAENALKYLYECVNKENTDILMSKDDKMVVSVKDSNIKYFFGDSYIENIENCYHDFQHIIFFDFSCSEFDANRMIYAIIESNSLSEDSCIELRNSNSLVCGENFDAKLIEYDLPYDIIRRTNDIYGKMRSALMSYNIPMLKECMGEIGRGDFISFINEYIGADCLYDIIITSIHRYMSFDYIDLIYDNHMKLTDVIGMKKTNRLLKTIFYHMQTESRTHGFNFVLPNEEQIKDFYNKNIGTRESAMYIGYYIVLKRILETEKEDFEYLVLDMIYNMYQSKGEVIDSLMEIVGNKLTFSSYSDTSKCWITYALLNGNEKLKNMAKEASKSNVELKKVFQHLTSSAHYSKLTF